MNDGGNQERNRPQACFEAIEAWPQEQTTESECQTCPAQSFIDAEVKRSLEQTRARLGSAPVFHCRPPSWGACPEGALERVAAEEYRQMLVLEFSLSSLRACPEGALERVVAEE